MDQSLTDPQIAANLIHTAGGNGSLPNGEIFGDLQRNSLFWLRIVVHPGDAPNAPHDVRKGSASEFSNRPEKRTRPDGVPQPARGRTRDRSFEPQRNRASGLTLVTAAIARRNTVYLERTVAHLRGQGEEIDDPPLGSLSPLGWDRINLTGNYVWSRSSGARVGGFRLLRTGRGPWRTVFYPFLQVPELSEAPVEGHPRRLR